MSLTRTAIDGALARGAKGERVELVDDREPGLRLRAGQRGAKWSLLARSPAGRRVRVPLGTWPGVGIAEARDEARKARRLVERGEDPVEHAKSPRVRTIGELFALYEEAKLGRLRSGKATKSSLGVALRELMDRSPAALTRAEVTRILDRTSKRAPVHANRILAYLRSFFGWAVDRGLMASNPALGLSPPVREVSRDRTPTLEELGHIWRAAEELGYPFGLAIQALILTATRREEVSAMRVAELQFDAAGTGGVWTIPGARTKTGRAIRVPLSRPAAELLQRAVASRPKDSEFVFSATGASAISGWSKVKLTLDKKVAERADVPAWRIHDFRRAFATVACDVLHVDPAVADRCLNHVGASTTSTVARVYGRSELFEQRRDALVRWAQLVEAGSLS